MCRHWRPRIKRGSPWLSPDAYDALSPAEKRQLWFERQQKRVQRSRPRPARYKKGYYARQRLMWMGGCFVLLPIAVGVLTIIPQRQKSSPFQSGPIEWNSVQAVPTRTPDAEDVEWEKRSKDWAPDQVRDSGAPMPAVRASFGYCKWGGGTNCVVDGDTFYLNGDKVRIAGIDAPETHDYRCDSELALGNQATEMLRSLLNSGTVTMTGIDRDRDVYGRQLRNVAVNGQDVGAAMIGAGVARDYGSGRRPWCS